MGFTLILWSLKMNVKSLANGSGTEKEKDNIFTKCTYTSVMTAKGTLLKRLKK